MSYVSGEECRKSEEKRICTLADGRQARCWCCPMGEISQSKGIVLVIDADR